MLYSAGSTSFQTKPTPSNMLDRYQGSGFGLWSLGSGNGEMSSRDRNGNLYYFNIIVFYKLYSAMIKC